MGSAWEYLRAHRWQRRLVTALVAIILGAAAGLLAYPEIRYWRLMAHLRSDSAPVRRAAIARAADLARSSPRVRRRLDRELRASDDRLFAAIATALNKAGAFYTPQRDPVQIDRQWAIDLAELAKAPQAGAARAELVKDLLLASRDNSYVRRATAQAAADASPLVRELAAVLAAAVGDDASLGKCLADPDPGVAGIAATDAGLAGRSALAEPLAKLLDSPDSEAAASAAYGLALLQPREYSQAICRRMQQTADAALRDRLLHVMTLLNDDPARQAVRAVLAAAAAAGQHPPAMALLAAGKLSIQEADAAVRQVLADAVKPSSGLTEAQVHAALQAADDLDLSVLAEADAICSRLWSSQHQPMLVTAARVLGRQISKAKGQADLAELVTQATATLRLAVFYVEPPASMPTTSQPPAGGVGPIRTPLASAAAAAALWLLDPAATDIGLTAQEGRLSAGEVQAGSAADLAMGAAGSADPTAGDYLAWHIGLSGRPEAFGLGLRMLPPRQAPRELKVYNDDIRAAGAMLLALAARDGAQRQQALDRIDAHVEGARLGAELPANLPSYWCALLTLGRTGLAGDVALMLSSGGLPVRRGIIALCAAGDKASLDWLLWKQDRQACRAALVDQGAAEVLRAAVPDLPAIDPAAEQPVQLWQLRIVQDAYAIHRGRIHPRLTP